MRQFIAAGEPGQPAVRDGAAVQSWYDGRRAGRGWRHLAHLSGGGQLNNSGSHMVDILLHVTDLKPKTVSAMQQNLELEVDVNMAINVQFEGGALGSVAIVGSAPGIGGRVYEDVSIAGSEAGLYYRMLGQPDSQPLLQLRRAGKTEPEADLPELPASSDPDRALST